MRTSSSQAEGAVREFQVATLEFIGEEGVLTGVKCCEVDERASRSPARNSSSRPISPSSPSASAARSTDSVLKELDGKLTLNTDKPRLDQRRANDKRLQDQRRQAL
jgi:glutamate synthase (NADPH/NADH) small chain